MNFKYLKKILDLNKSLTLSCTLIFLCSLINCMLINGNNSIVSATNEQQETIQIIKFKDDAGNENEEYAFRAPIKGYPDNVLKMYCANVKLRLYWNVFREEVKSTKRTGIHLRRLARFTRHLYEDIRTVDKPFNAKQLSSIDEWFGVKLTDDDQKELDHAIKESTEDSTASATTTPQPPLEKKSSKFSLSKSSSIKKTVHKVKGLIKKYAPTVVVGLYTRWRTMWWLMMSCLFAKYYLWDPALDEFIKLQRTMVMYPEFQLVKLKDVDCKPVQFFKHLLDTCRFLNPLMNIDFGQLNLDKMWQFKADVKY